MLRELFRFKTGLRSLAGIERELKRIGDLYAQDCAERMIFIRAPQPETTGNEPVMLYTDEEADAIAEIRERLGKRDQE